jgi:hypothetical protein
VGPSALRLAAEQVRSEVFQSTMPRKFRPLCRGPHSPFFLLSLSVTVCAYPHLTWHLHSFPSAAAKFASFGPVFAATLLADEPSGIHRPRGEFRSGSSGGSAVRPWKISTCRHRPNEEVSVNTRCREGDAPLVTAPRFGGWNGRSWSLPDSRCVILFTCVGGGLHRARPPMSKWHRSPILRLRVGNASESEGGERAKGFTP